MRSRSRRLIYVLSVLASTLLPPSAALAQPYEAVTLTMLVPLDQTVQGTRETIALNGTLHIVTHAQIAHDGLRIEIHTNLLNATAIGLSSGEISRVSGSQTVKFVLPDNIDPNALVQFVIAESFLNTQEELRLFATKVIYFNALRKYIAAEIKISCEGCPSS